MKYHKTLKKDKKILSLIEQFGDIPMLTVTNNLFVDIVGSIVSQQLSVKAADTIWKRFELLFVNKEVTPESLLLLPDDTIRSAGISYPKIKYMKGLATMILEKKIDMSAVASLSNEDVIIELTKIKGIGPWTAEMILMFSLGREDVFSLGDLGLRSAISKLYGVERDDLAKITEISDQWKPYRTYAARYLWKSLDNTPKTS